MTNLTSVSTFGWYSDGLISDQLYEISPFGWFGSAVVIPPEVCDSWQNAIISALRILLYDEDGVRYGDGELEDVIAVAANMVSHEVPLSTTYSIDITPPSISPDPVLNNDKSFVNLVTLKAACLLDKSTLGYNNLLSGISANCGNSAMSTLSRMNGFGSLIDGGYCLSYENAKRQYMSGTTRTKKAALSPFTNSNFDPTYYRK